MDSQALQIWAEALESRVFLSASAANLTQFHYDVQSTGQNQHETVLTPADVNATDFGKIFTTTLDGQVYATILAVANVNITRGPAQGIHNVLYAATMHDSLFAIDANTGAILWQDNFLQLGDPRVATILSPAVTAGVTTIPGGGTLSGENALINTNDIEPELGILSTPVIDTSTNRIYLLANSQERRNDTTTTSTPSDAGTDWHFVQRLWSLNLSDGSVAIAPNNSDAAEPTPTSGGKLVGDTILNPTGSNTFPSFGNFNGYKYVDGPFIKASGDNQTSSSNLD